MSARRRRWKKLRRRAEAAGVTPREVRLADEAAAALAVPPLYVLTVEGSPVSPESAERIRKFFDDSRGRVSFHEVLVLEPGPALGQTRVSVKLVQE